jgi:hypothetical protein
VDELNSVNSRLKHTNEELQEANEELQGANEELLLAQEELQATNEEFEATNEELQATNEELEATNEELTARTAELQDLSAVLTSEHGRLAELVETAPLSIFVMRGENLFVESVNAHLDGLPGGQHAVGRPLDEAWGGAARAATDRGRRPESVRAEHALGERPRGACRAWIRIVPDVRVHGGAHSRRRRKGERYRPLRTGRRLTASRLDF